MLDSVRLEEQRFKLLLAQDGESCALREEKSKYLANEIGKYPK